jgi:CHASE3 domain sensor protein
MALNAFLSINHLKQMRKLTAATFKSSMIQVDISRLLNDLTDMETGQRGYLLTENLSYLKPYIDAKGRIETDFAHLRVAFATRAGRERSMESQLESTASSLQADLEHSINLREQGYRHRAFMLISTNEGMKFMDAARGLLSSLSTTENRSFARANSEKDASLTKALTETIVANSFLLLLTVFLFGFIRYHGRALEWEAAQSRQVLALRDFQLEKLTSALSNQVRSETADIECNARLLLENYGGFLPRHGHEYAEQIRKSAAQMERLRQDLLSGPSPNGDEKAA